MTKRPKTLNDKKHPAPSRGRSFLLLRDWEFLNSLLFSISPSPIILTLTHLTKDVLFRSLSRDKRFARGYMGVHMIRINMYSCGKVGLADFLQANDVT